MKENEFTLNSATKYKDGEPMMTDLPVQLVRLLKRVSYLEKKVGNDEIGQYSARSLKEYFDDALTDEMEAVAKEYIKHDERIHELENQQVIILADLDELKYRLNYIEKKLNTLLDLTSSYPTKHTGSNFCGNCIHHDMGYEFPCCRLTGEACDHDDASCAMYEDSYVDTDSVSNQLDGKPDRKECNHCDKPDCSGCSNYPF